MCACVCVCVCVLAASQKRTHQHSGGEKKKNLIKHAPKTFNKKEKAPSQHCNITQNQLKSVNKQSYVSLSYSEKLLSSHYPAHSEQALGGAEWLVMLVCAVTASLANALPVEIVPCCGHVALA
jgi:LAS superfamily LD-carboxypeptidase LdcB